MGTEKRITVTLTIEKPEPDKMENFINNKKQENTNRHENVSNNELTLEKKESEKCKSPPVHGPPDTVMSLSVRDTGMYIIHFL